MNSVHLAELSKSVNKIRARSIVLIRFRVILIGTIFMTGVDKFSA